jgi:Arc/MetJ family transcription regulator
LRAARRRRSRRRANARQVFLEHSSEYVQFDQPEALVDAIREAHRQSLK